MILERLIFLRDWFIDQKKTLAVAESMTGGRLSERFTSLPGSSKFFSGGIIAYTDAVKIRVLGIPKEVIQRYTAISVQIAEQMATRVRRLMKTDYGIGVTGIAGPTSPSEHKPLGLVYIALNNEGLECVREFHFKGNRETIRNLAVEKTIEILHDAISME
jgi:nicotinamide-nucleotide amidase